MAASSLPVHRAAWLVLGNTAITATLPALMPDADFRFVESADLTGELATNRARFVIVVQPPAPETDVAAIAHERRLGRTPMRTVLLTEPGDLDGRLAALESGFDEALPVSIDARELVVRLRRLLQPVRPPTRRTALPIAEGVQLDLQAYELRTAGAPIRLRPKEFQLLALLATHPRRAFTRTELLERVWGAGFDGDPRTIDVHLRWLRSKVEPDPEHPVHLVTVRGRGYRFDPPR